MSMSEIFFIALGIVTLITLLILGVCFYSVRARMRESQALSEAAREFKALAEKLDRATKSRTLHQLAGLAVPQAILTILSQIAASWVPPVLIALAAMLKPPWT